jgi:hypothetical protein
MTADFLTSEIYRCGEGCHDDCSACRLLTELFQDTTEEWNEWKVMSRSRNLKTTTKVKVKVARRGLSALQILELIVPYPWRSSLIHLQRRHRTKRHESPLLAKEGTFCMEGILLATRNSPQLLGSFTCRKVGTWDRLFNFPSEGRHAEDFYIQKNSTASVGFEPANSGTRGQHATTRPPKPSKNKHKDLKLLQKMQFNYPIDS